MSIPADDLKTRGCNQGYLSQRQNQLRGLFSPRRLTYTSAERRSIADCFFIIIISSGQLHQQIQSQSLPISPDLHF